MKKILKIIGIVFLVLILIVAVGKNIIVKVGVEQGVKLVTGLPLEMKSLNIGILKTNIAIKDLKLFNPKGYPDKWMVDIPEIYVDYNLLPLLKKKIHLHNVRFHLKEFMVIRNKDGELNLDALKAIGAAKTKTAEKTPQTETQPKKATKAPDIQIDVFELKVGKVVYKDYSKGEKPSVKEFNINLDERIENITDPNALVSIIVFKSLASTTIASLANFDLGGLKDAVSGTLFGAADKAKALTGSAVQKTEETLKKTTEGLKNIIQLPFGNK